MSLINRVRFHGWLPQAAAATLLSSADIMVLPSMRECGGAAVLEGMACGIPVIATNWGGPADYLTKDAGMLIQPNPPHIFVEDLAKAILWMAKHPDDRIKMGQAGRDRVRALYDWRVKAKALFGIYEEVVNGCRNLSGITP